MRLLAFAVAFLLLFGCPAEQPAAPAEGGTSPAQEGHFEITGEEGASVSEGGVSGVEEPPARQYTENSGADLDVYFFNVGYGDNQGDAILIKKGDADILIDAGPKMKEKDLVDFLREKGVDDIEILISTHDDPEHTGGMAYVASKFRIGEVWRSTEGSEAYRGLLNSLGAEDGEKEVWDGDTRTLNGMELIVVNPIKGPDRFFDPTNDGVVLQLEDRELCFLFTGDILYSAQQKVVEKVGHCEIVQFPNHGMSSGLANIDYFIATLEPEVLVISGSPKDWTKSRITLKEKAELRDILVLENYEGDSAVIEWNGQNYKAYVET